LPISLIATGKGKLSRTITGLAAELETVRVYAQPEPEVMLRGNPGSREQTCYVIERENLSAAILVEARRTGLDEVEIQETKRVHARLEEKACTSTPLMHEQTISQGSLQQELQRLPFLAGKSFAA